MAAALLRGVGEEASGDLDLDDDDLDITDKDAMKELYTCGPAGLAREPDRTPQVRDVPADKGADCHEIPPRFFHEPSGDEREGGAWPPAQCYGG